MMTRKNYYALADAIGAGTALDGAARDAVVLEVSKVFAADNPRFDRAKFAGAVEEFAAHFCDLEGVELSPLPPEDFRRRR